MIILKELAEPRWVEMPRGVGLLVKPVTTAVMTAAKASARAALEALDEDTRADAALMRGLGFQTLLEAVAGYAVQDWRGVLDQAGAPLPCTRPALALLMREEDVAEAFFAQVVVAAEAVAAEGNASGPALPGTTARAPNTARAARPSKPSAAAGARTKRKAH